MPFVPFFVDSRACEARYQKLSSSIEEAVMREEAADFEDVAYYYSIRVPSWKSRLDNNQLCADSAWELED